MTRYGRVGQRSGTMIRLCHLARDKGRMLDGWRKSDLQLTRFRRGFNMIDELVPMGEATRRLGRSNETLRLWARAGRLRGRCLDGRLWVFEAASIEEVERNPPRPFGRQPKKI